MKAAVMTDIRKIELQERPMPSLTDTQVMVKVEYVGICGSDLHYYEQGRIGDFVVKPPFILGHEAAGTVVCTGAGVKGLKAGDRVALEPGKTCGHCEFCREGKYNLCPDVEFYATPPVDGVFQEYAVQEQELCFKLPENVDSLSGALVEPLAVGLHAAFQGGAAMGQQAVVMGAGCIGLVTLLALKAAGVSQVYLMDIMDNRLKKAMELGASGIFNGTHKDSLESLMEKLGKSGCDLVIDTAGTEVTVNQGIQLVKKGGTLVLVGYHKEDKVPVCVNKILDKEITVKSVFRYRNLYPKAIRMLSQGQINVKKIVSDEYSFDNISQAMEDSLNKRDEIVKAVIKM